MTQLEKGKTIVIMENQHHKNKLAEFIHDNDLTLLNQHPTPKYQRTIISTINHCKDMIPKELKHRYYNPNPTPFMIRALIKVHKNPMAIRPVINWKNAPPYPYPANLQLC